MTLPLPEAIAMERDAPRCSFRARWVFPADGPPLENGVVETAAGRITAVHQRPGKVDRELGNVALLPGLVNAHVHLEFSDLASPLPAGDCFTDWIQTLVAHRRTRTAPQREIVTKGLKECRAGGTVAVGEIATDDETLPQLRLAGARGVVFREFLGLLPERRDEQLAVAERHLAAGGDGPPETGTISGVRAGLSPHAPYSIHPELFQGLLTLAERHGAPIAMHLAETPAERELLEFGRGPFVEMLRRFGVWREGLLPTGRRPLDLLRELSRVGSALVIHGNFLDAEEVAWLRRHPHLCLVYCPRTHAHFGHAPHPWKDVLAGGGNVALGTDGRGSNPDLNLWDEVRFLRQIEPEVDPQRLLELATIRGARALGREADLGTLTPGKLAEMATAALPDGVGNDPWRALFDRRTVVRALDGSHPRE